ncbi:IS4 family transposase [Actinocrinis puniceicyclus]|uniref:IS4 family transposase n=1 Tax=Actinocrinis puniceicyclus TaxID=977794 RepID=A0A8J7WV23_9ACTN|nr:IS4 family transposase [Actinocrinis puniceicyclus]MBS2967002.1 IS4 family transposase [Actinocrinis puniceicyclus]
MSLVGEGPSGRVAVPSQVSVGVLAVTVPWFKVADAVAACGVKEKRSDGTLPAHVVAYLTMGLCLFADDPYEEVATKVTGSLAEWGCWNAAWPVPTASAITQARKRLGRDVLKDLFYRVAGPVAESATRGARLRGWRLTAVDGFELDLPDSKQNAAEFGYAGSERSGNRSAFPKARVVAVAECGTHAFLDAEVAGIGVGEKSVAGPLLDRLGEDWLLTADRGFYSFEAWGRARRSGAGLLWRAPTQLRLPLVAWLADGTYLSVLIKPGLREAARTALIEDAKAGRELDPERAHLVRVVEYDVPDREGKELIALITSITDPAAARADELASAYHQRWGATRGRTS